MLCWETNGHGKSAALNNETRGARFPLPSPPPVGEGANESLREFHVKGHGKSAALNNETRGARFPLPSPPPVGEGERGSLREFHVKGFVNDAVVSEASINFIED